MAGGANALVECRKNCNDGEEGGGVGEVEGKQISDGNPDVSHHHSPDREASVDVKPKRRGKQQTQMERRCQKSDNFVTETSLHIRMCRS